MAMHDAAGRTHEGAGVSGKMAEALWLSGQVDRAVERMEASFAVLSGDEPDQDLAMFVAQLARFHYFSGNLELARERVDFALRIAEDRVLPEVLSQALNTKNLVLLSESGYEEGLALLKHALDVAVEGDLTAAAGRALHNLGDAMMSANRYGEALEYDGRSLEQARRLGSRMDEWMSLVHLVGSHTALGEWDEALALVGQGPDPADGTDAEVFAALMSCWALDVFLARGNLEAARECVDIVERASNPNDPQDVAYTSFWRARLARAEGDHRGALTAAERAIGVRSALSMRTTAVRDAYVEAVEAALDLNELDRAEEFLALVEAAPSSDVPPSLRAHAARLRSKLSISRDEEEGVGEGFARAASLFRELALPFPLAITLLEHSEWLRAEGREAEATSLLAESSRIFDGLKATVWTARVDRARTDSRRAAAAASEA